MIANRLVLDTNVCLDLFVFQDARWSRLHTALETGSTEAFTRADCRAEWLLVLQYPRFSLDAKQISDCVAAFDRYITCLPIRDGGAGAGMKADSGGSALPRCSDTDDQKFLETMQDSDAAVLITKDKALLKLAGKCRRAGLFDIVTPQTWIAQISSLTASTY
ncbi:MAG: PIN domain-containing protein [Pseudomonadota bacterium]